MWPTVWVRSNVICNPIYHYQFGMKTCYIYIYIFIFFLSLRKRDHQGNLLAYIQCFCFRYAKCNSVELLTHICWSFRKYMKKVFRRKSTITEFKIERNRILSLLSFPSSILDAPAGSSSIFLLVSVRHRSISLGDIATVCWCAQLQNFQKRRNGSFH